MQRRPQGSLVEHKLQNPVFFLINVPVIIKLRSLFCILLAFIANYLTCVKVDALKSYNIRQPFLTTLLRKQCSRKLCILQNGSGGSKKKDKNGMELVSVEIPIQIETDKYHDFVKRLLSDKTLIRWYISSVSERGAVVEAVIKGG